MSRLEELIQELCPNGVEYKPISEIGTLTRGKRFVHADAVNEGVPCIHYGELYTYYGISTIDTKSFVRKDLAPKLRYARKNDVIIVGAGENNIDIGIGVAYMGDKDVAVHDACYILRHDLNPKYVSYCLRTEAYHKQIKKYVSSGKICSISARGIGKAVLPVPPLEVQREIVRILDNFTERTEELKKELTAEFTARKKQYEYYRDQLFEFDESIPHIQLKDLAKINIGLATSVTQHKCDNGVILIHNSDIQQNVIRLKSIEFISEDFAKKHEKKRLRKGDIITVHTGDVGTSAVIGDQFDGAIGFTTITTRIQDKEIINEFYLCHYFNSYRCKKDISLMTISDRSNLNQKSFEKLLIPVPSIEQQRRIVTILNRFDVICNDLKNGLPAEVEARKKQYEYYRDTLLNFERLEE